MADVDQNEVLQNLMAITGADDAAALHLLEATNWVLEDAVNLHFATADAGGAGVGGAGGAAGASAAPGAAGPLDSFEDEVRAPLPTKMERLYGNQGMMMGGAMMHPGARCVRGLTAAAVTPPCCRAAVLQYAERGVGVCRGCARCLPMQQHAWNGTPGRARGPLWAHQAALNAPPFLLHPARTPAMRTHACMGACMRTRMSMHGTAWTAGRPTAGLLTAEGAVSGCSTCMRRSLIHARAPHVHQQVRPSWQAGSCRAAAR